MKKTIFEFSHYRPYLRASLEASGARGSKAQIAEVMAVQATYVSQVLQEKAHLSLEQAEGANTFLKHTTQESHYFMLLVQKDRAGTKTLREYFQKQIDAVIQSRMNVTERLGKSMQLEEKDRTWYYASWIPAAIHIAVTIPTLRTVSALTKALQLPEEKILQVLERLESIGLVAKQGTEYHTGVQVMRLGNESHHIIKHHTNWRLQAMQSLDREVLNELHYSAVFSLSRSDILKIKDMMLEAIQKNAQIVKDSKEEELCCLTVDFFNLLR